MSDPALPIAVAFIAAREGFRSAPYTDQGGRVTYGYGFTYTADGKAVCATTPPVTQEDAYAHLRGLVAAVLVKVREMIHPPVSDHAAAACTSLAYNIGTHALRTSTLMRRLNTGETANAADQFGAWIYDSGRRDPGLVNRRALERTLFLTADAAADSSRPSIQNGDIPESEADRLDDEFNREI